MPRKLADALSIDDLRVLALRRLPAFASAYVESGADDCRTLQRNRATFDRLLLMPRQLCDVSDVETRTPLLGSEAALPFAIGPTGYNGMLTHEGDLMLARTARAAGIPFVQSTMSSSSIEEVAHAIDGGRHWFQMYVLKDPAISQRLMERAHAAGCEALVVTTDAVVLGNRESDRRNFVRPQELRLSCKIDALLHPRWLFDVLVPHGAPIFGNLTEFLPKDQWSTQGGAQFIANQMDAALSWERLKRIRAEWRGKLIVKGILRADDARKAADLGADGLVASNHGGRQLDGTPSPIEALPAIVQSVGDRCEIYADSGFRRGTDVFKAFALGARGALLGRAVLYGLAAGSEAGARRAIGVMSEEFRRTMALMGCRRLADIDETLIAWSATLATDSVQPMSRLS